MFWYCRDIFAFPAIITAHAIDQVMKMMAHPESEMQICWIVSLTAVPTCTVFK